VSSGDAPVRLSYTPALDGVRAVAIAGVLALHGSLGVQGGFLGVDVFFVLSGFLITALLLGEHNTAGSVSLRAFYARRARRLLPALVLLCVGVAILYGALASLGRGIGYAGSVAAVLSFGGNWVQAYHQHAAGGRLGLFDPAWSLGIEEQFYLVWPLLLVFLLRRHITTRVCIGLLVGGAICSAVLRALTWWHVLPGSAYFGTHTRADGLLLGCALAVLWHSRAGAEWLRRFFARGIVPLVVLCVFIVAAWRFGVVSDSTYTFGIFVVDVAAVALLAHLVIDRRTVAHRVLGSTALVWLGARSYGVYLFHWPVFSVITAARLHTSASDAELFPLRVAVVLIVAALSYRFVERPFLRRRGASLRRLRSTPAAAA
jgi:peptidoglycan/LPS O-acetylase OafA/YrhL